MATMPGAPATPGTSEVSVAAVILAGGRAERLGGVDKAVLEIGGERFIDRVLGAIGSCGPVLLAGGGRLLDAGGTTAIPDLAADYGGPLAGVAAAIEALRSEPAALLLSVAVDTPFFPPDFLRRAQQLLPGHDVVLAAYDGQDYPTDALWRLAAVRTLPADVRAGIAPRSLRRLAAGLRAARLDYAPLAPEDPFANANTPADLAQLQARAARREAG